VSPEIIETVNNIIAICAADDLSNEEAFARLSKAFSDKSLGEGRPLPEAMRDEGYKYKPETGEWTKW